jgi:membrane-associated protease RseP (regulator of RpoE activity)
MLRSNFVAAWIVAGAAVVGSAFAIAQVAAPPPTKPPEKAPKAQDPREEKGAPPKSEKAAPPGRETAREPRRADADTPDRKASDRSRERKGLGIEFDTAEEKGLIVSTIEEDSLAAEAGLRANDKIVSADGRTFRTQRQLQAYLGGQTGRRVPLIIERGGQRYSVHLALNDGGDGAWLGVFLQEGEEGQTGAAITQVYPAGPAARAGLRAGDVITKVNDRDVEGAADLIGLIEEMEPGAKADLALLRGKQQMTAKVTLGSRESFVYQQRGREEFDENADSREDDYFSNVPPYAMQMEHDRRMAEQHERMEAALIKLQEEVRKLREAVEKKN